MPFKTPVLAAVIAGAAGLALIGCQSSLRSSDNDGGVAGTGGQAGQGGQVGQAGQGGQVGQAGQGGQAGQTPVGGQPGQAGGDDIALIMASYRSWSALSDAPLDISAEIYGLCRSPTAAEQAFIAGPHTHYALRDWANPLAVATISAKGEGGFPAGAAIVKEKFATDAQSGAQVLAALGIMVKRATGFDPSGGDWEFVYWNPTDGVSRGATELGTCTTCHAGAGATDFVFLDQSWRTLSPR